MSVRYVFLIPPISRSSEVLVSYNYAFAERGPLCRLP